MKIYIKPTSPDLIRIAIQNGRGPAKSITFQDVTLFDATVKIKSLLQENLFPKRQSSIKTTIQLREYSEENGSSTSFHVFDTTPANVEKIILGHFEKQ